MRDAIVLDPMLATGNSSAAAITAIKAAGARKVTLICLVAAPEGVDALVKNLGSKKPLPVYFESHDMRQGGEDGKKVLVTDKGRPVFYIERDYLVISLPMKPWDQEATRGGAQAPVPAPKARKVASKKKK